MKNRIKNLSNINLQRSLSSFLKDILIGNFPIHIFDDINSFRASNLMFKGTCNNKLAMRDLLFHLDATSFITETDTHNLQFQTDKFITKFMKLYGVYPNHSNVLNFLFMNNTNLVSLETLVWKRMSYKNNYMTGHIDALIIDDNCLKICDLKRNKYEIIRYLPQLITYAKLLRNYLKKYVVPLNISISCIGLSPDMVYEFDPFIAETKVITCITNLNRLRVEPLFTKDNKNLLLGTLESV